MIKKTIWRPDTCNSVIEFQWDDSVPAEQRQISLSRVISKCPLYANMTDEEMFQAVLSDNQKKNIAVEAVKSVLLQERSQKNLGESKEAKLDVEQEIKFKYNKARELEIEVASVTDKNSLEADLRSLLSDEKIRVK